MVLGVLWLIGFALMLIVPVLTSDVPLAAPITAFAALWPLIRGKVLILAAILLTSLAIRWQLGEADLLVDLVCVCLGLALFAPYAHWLCPRCELHVARNWTLWRTYDIKPYCPACGRSRAGVKPFQHLYAPEAWDGTYHDEGGGEPPSSHHLDTMVYHTTERWKRKYARRR